MLLIVSNVGERRLRYRSVPRRSITSAFPRIRWSAQIRGRSSISCEVQPWRLQPPLVLNKHVLHTEDPLKRQTPGHLFARCTAPWNYTTMASAAEGNQVPTTRYQSILNAINASVTFQQDLQRDVDLNRDFLQRVRAAVGLHSMRPAMLEIYESTQERVDRLERLIQQVQELIDVRDRAIIQTCYHC